MVGKGENNPNVIIKRKERTMAELIIENKVFKFRFIKVIEPFSNATVVE